MEVDGQPSVAEGDVRDPQRTWYLQRCRVGTGDFSPAVDGEFDFHQNWRFAEGLSR
jgi:hypothetical protein